MHGAAPRQQHAAAGADAAERPDLPRGGAGGSLGRTSPSPNERCPMRTVTVLLLVGWLLVAGKARAEEAKPLPDDVVKAWQKAGARAGWMGPHRTSGRLTFTTKRDDLDA